MKVDMLRSRPDDPIVEGEERYAGLPPDVRAFLDSTFEGSRRTGFSVEIGPKKRGERVRRTEILWTGEGDRPVGYLGLVDSSSATGGFYYEYFWSESSIVGFTEIELDTGFVVRGAEKWHGRRRYFVIKNDEGTVLSVGFNLPISRLPDLRTLRGQILTETSLYGYVDFAQSGTRRMNPFVDTSLGNALPIPSVAGAVKKVLIQNSPQIGLARTVESRVNFTFPNSALFPPKVGMY